MDCGGGSSNTAGMIQRQKKARYFAHVCIDSIAQKGNSSVASFVSHRVRCLVV